MEEGVYIWNEDFYLWLNEWMSIDKRLSFFFVCLRERVRVRESRNKSFSECMCAVLSLFPRTEVWRGLIFLAAVRSGWEAETARGSCFLWGSPASSHMAFDPFWLPSPTKLPPPPQSIYHYIYVCEGKCMSANESGSCYKCSKGCRWWQTVEQTVKLG